MQSLPIAVLRITPEGKIINANKKTFDLLGITLEQIKNTPAVKLFSPFYHNELQSIFNKCLNSNKACKIDRVIGFGNSPRTVLNLYVQKIEDDSSPSLLVGVQDLTAIEESNKILAKTSEYLQALLDNMADGVISIDSEGTIKSINLATSQIFGLSDEKIKGVKITHIVPNFDMHILQNRPNENTHNAPLKKGCSKYELFGQKANGQKFPLTLTLSKMNIEGEKIFCGIIQDISGQKKYEETLKQKNEELIRINEDMEQFVYMVSHDLQEPLRAINNYFQIFNSTNPDAQETPYFDKISKCIDRMKNLIQGILQYSQIDVRNEYFSYINMDKMLNDFSETFTETDSQKKVFIKLENIHSVRGYKPLVEVLFQNLLLNGIKYNKNKEVMLHIDSDIWAENEEMIIYSVKDNGIGIPAESQAKIFKMFQRLHSAEEYKGLGIGLASCKKIVELHQGKIWTESNESEGTTFYFTLPKYNQAELEDPQIMYNLFKA